MILVALHCPSCDHDDVIKHGRTAAGKQPFGKAQGPRYRCQNPECEKKTFICSPFLLGSLQLCWTIKSLLIPMALRDFIFSKRDEILALAAQYDAVNVRLFGSVARESERPDSDVDFLVDVQRQWSLFDHIGLIQDLEDLIGRKVDLIPSDRIREFCRDRILSEAIPL
jgi:uncharacterized protein